MRKSFLLYLFVFTVLLAVVQYVNAKKILESKDEKIEYLEDQLTLINNKLDSLAEQNTSFDHFSLTSNENALTYFENMGYEVSEISRLLEDEIIGRNKASADNELVPFEGMQGNMRINKIRVLNHKWILADFTDGTYWGEIFITYFFDENYNLNLETEKSLLYPIN